MNRVKCSYKFGLSECNRAECSYSFGLSGCKRAKCSLAFYSFVDQPLSSHDMIILNPK